jgi:hypothetical protein
MGKITLLSSSLEDLLPMQGRSPVLHVSDVINDLCIRLGYHKEDTLPSITRMQLGCALEHAIAHRYSLQYPNRYFQPGELNDSDNFPGTPDLIDSKLNAIVEIKLTWMSSKHPPDGDKFLKYWWQVKEYTHKMHFDLGFLHVGHIMGDYRGFDVHYNIWEQRFTKQELIDNHSMLLKHRDRMLKQGKGTRGPR